MRVSRWGNRLAVRLPSAVVDAFGLKEGDEIEISIAGKRDIKAVSDQSKEKALEAIRRLARPFPEGFKFYRGRGQ
jgi:antitoxin MazE